MLYRRNKAKGQWPLNAKTTYEYSGSRRLHFPDAYSEDKVQRVSTDRKREDRIQDVAKNEKTQKSDGEMAMVIPKLRGSPVGQTSAELLIGRVCRPSQLQGIASYNTHAGL